MKYFFTTAIIAFSFFAGRWSVKIKQVANIQKTKKAELEVRDRKSSNFKIDSRCSEIKSDQVECGKVDQDKSTIDKRFVRTKSKQSQKKIKDLFYALMEAIEEEDVSEQNLIFSQMESLDPLHEKVFQAKVMFLQQDGDWEGAHKTLKKCSEKVPDSLYCHKRLSNIRSSSVEDKIKHGELCLKIKSDDPQCLVDLAISYQKIGKLDKSKEIFETALDLSSTNDGFDRGYILYQYGFTLEGLFMFAESYEVFSEACQLKLKAACGKTRGS